MIQVLPDHIANQIAAGEVIQRPASAVKELLENAVDAGATSIELIIQDAGKSLVQVVDNGKGMSVEDARLCIARHATSKSVPSKTCSISEPWVFVERPWLVLPQ
ncbi:MAG: ATP-binding protein [Bacteroidota bacterium]